MTALCVTKTPTRSSHTHFYVQIDPLSNKKLGILVKNHQNRLSGSWDMSFLSDMLFLDLKLHYEAAALPNIKVHSTNVCLFVF